MMKFKWFGWFMGSKTSQADAVRHAKEAEFRRRFHATVSIAPKDAPRYYTRASAPVPSPAPAPDTSSPFLTHFMAYEMGSAMSRSIDYSSSSGDPAPSISSGGGGDYSGGGSSGSWDSSSSSSSSDSSSSSSYDSGSSGGGD